MFGAYCRQPLRVCGREGTLNPALAMSVVYCSAKYGASPNNYESFGFDKLAHRQRQTYFTYRHNQGLMKRANKPEAVERLLDK